MSSPRPLTPTERKTLEAMEGQWWTARMIARTMSKSVAAADGHIRALYHSGYLERRKIEGQRTFEYRRRLTFGS